MYYEDWSDPMNNIFASIHGTTKDPITKEVVDVYKYKIVNNKGMSIEVSEYGATLLSVIIRDIDAKDAELEESDFVDVVLGLPELEDYVKSENYFGATIGRVSSRLPLGIIHIRKHSGTEDFFVADLNDKKKHHFNGGALGFHKMIWKFHTYNTMGITLRHVSPKGWQGYPGEVIVYARFALTTDNMLNIEYTADSDALTYLNMSSHIYFNLAGHSSGTSKFAEHKCAIRAEYSVHKDQEGCASGSLVKIDGTPFNLMIYDLDIAEHLRALDNGFNIDYVISRIYDSVMVEAAFIQCCETSLCMEVLTNQMGAIFYTGNKLPKKGLLTKGIKGKDNAHYYKNQMFCLMPQKVPNILNQNNMYKHYRLYSYPEVYHHDTLYRFTFDIGCKKRRLRVGVPQMTSKGRTGKKYYEPVWVRHDLFTRNKQLMYVKERDWNKHFY